MRELLAVVIVLMPYWLFALTCVVALLVAYRVAKRFKGSAAIAVGITSFLVVVLLPFLDGIVGYLLFQHYCAKTGPRFYETLTLPATYWDEKGRPTFIRPDGHLNRKVLGDRIRESSRTAPYVEVLGITEYRHQVVDTMTKKVLGEVVTFGYWGGWVSRNLRIGPPSGTSCKNFRDPQLWEGFYPRLFRSANTN